MAGGRRPADLGARPRHRLGLRALVQDSHRGSAVVEFVLVAPILLLVALAVVQVALAAHVRATLTSAAAEGARAAALAGSDPGAGERRTWLLLDGTVGRDNVRSVTAYATTVAGLPVMAVRIEAELPPVGLLGPTDMVVEGHALQEMVS